MVGAMRLRFPRRLRRRAYRQTAALLPMSARGISLELQGEKVLKDIDLKLRSGEIVAIVGRNGAGKSLLLKTLYGLIEPTSGQVKWAGAPVREIWRHQALILQRPGLLRRSVAANIDYALRIRDVRRLDRLRRITEGLRVARLVGYARKRALSLSIGEQQRVAFAQAWAVYPDALFLDEVTSALDPVSKAVIEDLIDRLRGNEVGILMVSQDMEQVKALADRVVFLHEGELISDTSTKEFFTGVKDPRIAAFLAQTEPTQTYEGA